MHNVSRIYLSLNRPWLFLQKVLIDGKVYVHTIHQTSRKSEQLLPEIFSYTAYIRTKGLTRKTNFRLSD